MWFWPEGCESLNKADLSLAARNDIIFDSCCSIWASYNIQNEEDLKALEQLAVKTGQNWPMNEKNGKCNSKHRFGGHFFDPPPIWSQQNPIAFFHCHHDRSCQRIAKTNRPFVIQVDKAKGGLNSWKWGLQRRLQSHWFEACNFLVKCSPAEMRAYLHFFGKKMVAVIQTKIDDSQVVLQWALGWSLCTYTGWPWEHSCDSNRTYLATLAFHRVQRHRNPAENWLYL